VGCGPTGATLAILLAQLGHRVVVLERQTEPYPLPRAVHIDHTTARILQACGIGSQLQATTEAAEVYEWRSATGTPLLRFGRLGAGLSGWPESLMLHQPTLEALLEGRLSELEVDVRRGVELTGLDQTPAGVTTRATDRSGREVAVASRYVVGCDGAGSTVGSLIAAPTIDLGFSEDWLIVDVLLREPREFNPVNLQVCDPARPTTAVSGAGTAAVGVHATAQRAQRRDRYR
jgi:flavoprotein hydroxylase